MPFAVLGLPAYLALFTALGFALARLIWLRGPKRCSRSPRPHGRRMAARACAHRLSMECVRLRACRSRWRWRRAASLIGLWGLTFLPWRSLPPGGAHRRRVDTPQPWRAARSRRCSLLRSLLRRHAAERASDRDVANVKLRIMQPNLQQDVKFNYSAKAEVMQRYLRAVRSRRRAAIDRRARRQHLIWPESAFPFFLTREADAMAQIAELLRQGTVLITGAVRAGRARDDDASPAPTIRFTSSTMTARSVGSTTSCIWCRSANICRSRT